jgi:hypothetical protein
MRYMFANHIHLGTRELDTNDIYLFRDILSVLGVLPSAIEGETTILRTLNTFSEALSGHFQLRKIPSLLKTPRQKRGYVDDVEKPFNAKAHFST